MCDYYKQRYGFPGVISAMDGTHVMISKPPGMQFSKDYFSVWKKMYTMLLQVCSVLLYKILDPWQCSMCAPKLSCKNSGAPPQCSRCLASFDTVVDVYNHKMKNSGPPSHPIAIRTLLRMIGRMLQSLFYAQKVTFILLIVCPSSMQIDRTHGPKTGIPLRKSHSSFYLSVHLQCK